MTSAYSVSQIDKYEEYVQLPTQFRRNANPAKTLEYLTALHVHQISTIPYDNLILHYSESHQISLGEQDLFEKLTKDNRGGYCMEVSIMFNHVLRALGFNAYTAGVRIRPRVNGVPEGDYRGW
jgi:arylamine N-acetyltransferase